MRILVTNDDGIHAPGLEVLERVARAVSDDVWVVAPESDQSGVSHSLSLNDPLRLREIGGRRFAVKGTPTDCVILALRHIMVDAQPDLILSGINRGQNAAEDVTYSGTIAAAMEGTLLGIRSIALSQAYSKATRGSIAWDCGEQHAPALIRRLVAQEIAPGTLINVNFPDCAPDQVAGIAMTVQGRRDKDLLSIDARVDGRGNPYFWIGFGRGFTHPGHGTDLAALAQNKISVTPLRLDLTDEPTLTQLAAAFAEADGTPAAA
jgi:5'-nucleotidase